jgi:hypothetical protein
VKKKESVEFGERMDGLYSTARVSHGGKHFCGRADMVI